MTQPRNQRDSPLAAPVHGVSEESLLSFATIDRLRELLAAAKQGRAREEQLLLSAAAIVSDAHQRSIRVEEMLVRVKAEWMPMLEEQDIPWTEAARELTSRLITHCISAYYMPAPNSTASSGASDGR